MKKLFISKLFLCNFLLINNSLAKDYFINCNPYISFGSNINKISTVNIYDKDFKGKIKSNQIIPALDFGLGVQIPNNIRLEVNYNYNFIFFSKEKLKNQKYNILIDTKTKANVLLFNIIKDVYIHNNVSLYLGAGAGFSLLQEKGNGVLKIKNRSYDLLPSSKNKSIKPAYKITLGLSQKLSDKYFIDFSYNYFDLNYNKQKESVDNAVFLNKRRYNLHNFTIKLRYNI